MTDIRALDDTIYRCTLCDTVFEAGVADATAAGPPRCPQCGFGEAEAMPAAEHGEDVVIRRTTKFR